MASDINRMIGKIDEMKSEDGANIPTSPDQVKMAEMSVSKNTESFFKKLKTKSGDFFKREQVKADMKYLLLAIPIIAIFVITAALQRNQTLISHAGTAVLSLSSSNPTPKIGVPFTVVVAIDTKGLAVTAADIRVRYDTAKLTANKIIPFGDFLPTVLYPPGQTQGILDLPSATSGRAWIVVGALVDNTGTTAAPGDVHPRSGTGILAQVTFTPKTNGSTTITFGGETAVAAVGQTGDVTATKNSVTINIGGSTTPTTSPNPVTPTPLSSTNPTPKPSSTPTVKPSPTPAKCIPSGQGCSQSTGLPCCYPATCVKPVDHFYCRLPKD